MDKYVVDKRQSAVDIVLSNIRNMIMKKELKPGDRVPTETEICEAFAVSRGPVREAMKILSALGIVEIRRGQGTFIATSSSHAIVDSLWFEFILSDADVREMFELREHMELSIMEMAIKNADKEDIEAIKAANEELIRKKESGATSAELSALDLNFHEVLVRATKNRLYNKIYRFVLEFLEPTISKTYSNRSNEEVAYTVHDKIVQALEERDYRKGVAAIENSIELWSELAEMHKKKYEEE